MSVFDVAFAHPCAYTRMDALVFMCVAFPGSGFVFCLLACVAFAFYGFLLIFITKCLFL